MAANERTKQIAKLATRLKPSHKAFADLVLLGTLSYTDAYLQIWPPEPGQELSRKDAGSAASRILGNQHVKAYVEAITEASVDALIVTRAELLSALRDVALSGVTQGPGAGARVQAAKTLIDLVDGTAPIKLELTGKDGKPSQQEHRHGGLSPAQAEAIKVNILGLPPVKAPDAP
jgi:hypothetical protein